MNMSVILPASSRKIRYTGRVLPVGDSVHFGFPGTEILLRFTGSSLGFRGAVFAGGGWFNLTLDGEHCPVIALAEGNFHISLAADLDPELEHTIRLVRRNEAWQGTLRLDAFYLDAGAVLLSPPPLPARRILCLGDSITSGEGVDYIPPRATEGNHNANAEGSFGWVLAKHFGASVHLVSFGGRGIVRDWQGLFSGIRAIELFERTLPDEQEPPWDHSSYTPHLVTIGFGTNDFGVGLLSHDEFVLPYIDVVSRVHRVHPGAKILILSSPIMDVTPRDETGISNAKVLEGYLEDVREHFLSRGEDFVKVHKGGYYPGTEFDPHPIAPQHKAIAGEMIPLVAEWLDW